MAALEVFIGSILPYITLLCLIAGLSYRIQKWRKAAVANLALYPATKSRGELWRRNLSEIFMFESFRKEHLALWWQTWPLHVAIALIVLGHSRLITDWPLRVLLGMSAGSVNALSAWAGGAAGLVAMLTCLGLIVRRHTIQRVREISSGEDFIIVYLLLAIFVTGNIMRFVTHFDIALAREYFATLFTFQARVPSDPLFLLHYFLVQLLLIYLPFGKLLHVPGVFFSRTLIAKDY